jgi:hypothetical protein
MNHRALLLALLASSTILAATAAALPTECVARAGYDAVDGTYGKLVYENLVWPQDAALHITYYLEVYAPRFLAEAASCL